MVNLNDYIINKTALLGNMEKIRRYIGYSTKLCAVVKADAYGLGVKNVCPIINDEVDYYAVVSVMEALELRKIVKQKPILVLGACNLNYANECAKNDIDLTISSIDEVKFLNENLESVLKVHLKINTGMNRYGIDTIKDLKKIISEIENGHKIIVEGVYTHFATKASDVDFIEKQYKKFEKMIKIVPYSNLIVHCASSYVATTDKLKLCNMVRIGFSLYGDLYERLNIKNVVSVKARVTFVHTISAGESVGYDRTFIAKHRTKIAVCSMGYADGFARNLGNNFRVIINGQFAHVVGRVCMDCFMIDVTNIRGVFVGSGVTVLGEDGENKITLSDIGKAISFSPYEVLLNFRKRRMNVVVKK